MGLFSSIGKAVKKVGKAVTGVFKSPLAGVAGTAIGSMVGMPGLGAAVGSGLGSYFGQEAANDANSAQAMRAMSFEDQQAIRAMQFETAAAKTAMDFSKKMSNTAWQRGVRDMRRAGINPILAYQQGGASSPQGTMAKGFTGSGHQATMQNSEASGLDAFNSTINSAMAYKQLKPKIDQLNANAQYLKDSAFAQEQSGWVKNAEVANIQKDTLLKNQSYDLMEAEKEMRDIQIKTAKNLYEVQKSYLGYHKSRAWWKDNNFFLGLGEFTGALGNIFAGAGTAPIAPLMKGKH